MARPSKYDWDAIYSALEQGHDPTDVQRHYKVNPSTWRRQMARREPVVKKSTLEVGEWVAIDDLTPWDKNPRINDAAVPAIAESIRRFGWGNPILARRADRVVIAGHTRLKAARSLGMDKVPVRWMDLDPAEAAALALADNKLGELADWDDAGLRGVLAELEADGLDLDGLGWNDEELSYLLADAGEVVTPEGGETEIDVDGFDLSHTCPRCGMEFNDD